MRSKMMGCREEHQSTHGSVLGGKPNHCVIYPPKSSIAAEELERRNNDWLNSSSSSSGTYRFVRTKVASDLMVQVGDFSFHLHKLAMVSKSGYLNRLVFAKRSEGHGHNGGSLKIVLDDLPGGTNTFESIVNFCYGFKVDVTATTIAPLYCAANFLEMSDDLHQGNLISKTEAFLSFAIFSSWKDTFKVLKSCESVSPWSKDLLIVKQCSDAIAWKASTDPKAFTLGQNSNGNLNVGESSDTWWFQDVSTLRIDHFIQVIESIKRKGVKPELVGSCIAHWTAKWFSGTTFVFDDPTIPKHLTQKLQRITIESLINMLPVEKKSVSCNFLLYLVKLGLKMQVNSELLSKLETRIASMLEQCCAQDLLVKNYGDKDTTYDVGIVIRVVKAYVLLALKNFRARLCIVGRLIDGYLTLVARDINLTVIDFKLLVDALPTTARSCDNNLYRAIDMYLKAHPSLIEEERASVCKAMEYHRLSEDARQHAMRNGRLPLKIVTEFMLLEQVKMARSVSATKSNINPRTTTQTIMKMNNKKCLEKGFIAPQKEIMLIRKEVENMKMQLNQLQMCKLKLQKQAQRSCIK
ncbi:coleoptile phototropism protein 1-like [Gossypium australe]|uniref:Coleoptile phototropism protein 1-like n=1 Tax=Gossypium australe TaxID=47621 RepID=A0A5B6VDS2_9ROSI|nr:coleoptile phototropism protein 1-like [Gossypium australe]